MQRARLFLWLVLTCASGAQCRAAAVPNLSRPSGLIQHIAEGFFAENMPPAVRSVWPSVYALVCASRAGVYTASAFFVHKADHASRSDYYFITAGHALEECKNPGPYLAENIDPQRFESDGITLARPPQRLGDLQFVSVDDAYDIAIIKVVASPTLRLGRPLTVDDKCDQSLHREIYSVGFPGVTKRRSLHLGREVKRWSKGDYVGLGKADFRGVQSTYIASTVDSLPGNSGGPVVDERGVLVGVVVQGAASPENNFRYDVDPRKQDDWHSFLVPCHAVLRLMERSGLRELSKSPR